jgi:uncharacterized protein (TIGR04255 family)
MDKPKVFLHPPKVDAVRYAGNFIKTAVCELRFPALLELEAKPPRAFQSKIRKLYPFYDTQFVDQMDEDQVAREHRYLFRSKDKHWTVSVKSFAIALETSKYVDFEEFFERLNKVIDSARDMIDADFFTRVGLRYINTIPMDTWEPTGWVRPELLSAYSTLPLGAHQDFACVVTGEMENGKYTIRHGVKKDEDPKNTEGPKYTLDFDYYCENVEATAVSARVTQFNKTNFALFSWCLGDKAKKLLGPGKPK